MSGEPAEIDGYARAGAAAFGLAIEDEWWPGVIRHLGVLLSRASSLESFERELPEDPAPVFQP